MPVEKRKTTSQGGNKSQAGKQIGDNLEPYRRLVELQKQMIELAQKHEESRRECEALRKRMAEEIAARKRGKRVLNRTLRTAASKVNLLKRGESLPC